MNPMRDAVQMLVAWVVAWVVACGAGLALAQTAPDAPISGVPMGQGAGVHGANSPYAPLTERNDVLPWSLLTAVKTKTEKNRILPVFGPDIQALNLKSQRIHHTHESYCGMRVSIYLFFSNSSSIVKNHSYKINNDSPAMSSCELGASPAGGPIRVIYIRVISIRVISTQGVPHWAPRAACLHPVILRPAGRPA